MNNLYLILEVARLALADIWHEWRMSLCLVLAIAVIASPLLLFFGLKSGTVTSMRQRLLKNPVNREIQCRVNRNFTPEWFETWRKHPLVAFVLPKTRTLSAQVELSNKNAPLVLKSTDVHPTGAGDVLMERYNMPIPDNNSIIVSQTLATNLNLKTGDTVICTVSRNRIPIGREVVTKEFTVAGILPISAGTLPTIYMTLYCLENIEDYKDGRSVPEFGWAGHDPLASPNFSSVLVCTDTPMDELSRIRLVQNTGFIGGTVLDQEEMPRELKLTDKICQHLQTRGNLANLDNNIATLQEKLRGVNALLIPLGDTSLSVIPSGWSKFSNMSFSLFPATAINESLPNIAVPKSLVFLWQELEKHENPQRIFLANPEDFQNLQALPDAIMQDEEHLVLPIKVVVGDSIDIDLQHSVDFNCTFIANKDVAKGAFLTSPALLGIMNSMLEKDIQNGRTANNKEAFLISRKGYPSFRMYATGLEEVDQLAKDLQETGIETDTKVDRIEEVLRLNDTLNLLFFIIASASFIGGIACLMANIYANVERKRRELAVLGLLGIHGMILKTFPIVSVLSLCSGGLALAFTLFHSLAGLINTIFTQPDANERFCFLSWEQQVIACLCGLFCAFFAGLLAARRISAIDPSEGLRDE